MFLCVLSQSSFRSLCVSVPCVAAHLHWTQHHTTPPTLSESRPPLMSSVNQRFFSPFYLVHLFLVLVYLSLRCFVWSKAQLEWLYQPTGFLGVALFPREFEILLLLAIVLASRYRKSATIDHYLLSVTLFSKVYIMTMLWNVDRQLMGWFGVAVFTLFILFKAPKYSGPTKVTVLDKGTFQEMIVERPKISLDKRRTTTTTGSSSSSNEVSASSTWLVEITANWHSGSTCYSPTFAELSLRFSSDELSFATIDVARWPTIAETNSINTSAYNSSQLPSYILFEHGKEVKRLPPMDKNGSPVETFIEKEGIIQYFDLAKRLLDARNKKRKTAER